jgi:hypothetical protein
MVFGVASESAVGEGAAFAILLRALLLAVCVLNTSNLCDEWNA